MSSGPLEPPGATPPPGTAPPPGATALGGQGILQSPSQPTSTTAIIGFVLAILSWLMCPVIAAIAALILARTSSKEIAAAQDRLSGAGLNTATRIIAWVNIGVSILAGLAIALLVAFGVIFTASVASGLDPAMNARTGLADGTYVIDPSTRVNLNSECSYGGPAFASDGAEFPYTAVYGKGPIQCPDLTQVATVEIEVDGGVARIVNVR